MNAWLLNKPILNIDFFDERHAKLLNISQKTNPVKV